MEEEKITVSVVVPVYQTPLELLRRCLDSLEAQTLEGVEVLLAFDEPADGYRDTVDPYAQRMALRVLELPHGGVSAARNAGIRHAQGEWISFVDADDWIDPEMLARQVQEGESRGADIIMTEHVMEYGASSQPRGYQSQAMLFAGEDKRRFECDVLKPQTGAGFVTAKLLRRALLMEREIFFREELSAAEDAEFMFRAACAARCIAYLPLPMYHYWFNAGSAVRRYRSDYAQRYIRSMEAIRADLDQMGDREYCRDAYHSCVLYHLLLIAVNDSFHPDNGLGGRAQRKAFRDRVRTALFAQCLEHVHLGDFSTTRKVTLLCVKLRFYYGVYLIAKVRHWQFRKFAGQ